MTQSLSCDFVRWKARELLLLQAEDRVVLTLRSVERLNLVDLFGAMDRRGSEPRRTRRSPACDVATALNDAPLTADHT
jgi:hypothetical protein